jgi:predicted RecB family nuclease
MARGIEHEQRVIERKYPECRTLDFEMPEAGFRIILEEMAKGTDVICGLPLFFLPENMQGRIDVLERRNDRYSVFGNYYYIVTEIKLVKKIRREHILQAAFYRNIRHTYFV